MVLQANTLFVADFVSGADVDEGRIARYDVNSGKYLGSLTPTDFPGQFNPRGVVFGPDGQLYVGVFSTSNPLAGYIVRFNTTTGASEVVASNNGDGVPDPGEVKDLHRPEGLVFGPDGLLYVTSFRADQTDNDRILVLDASDGSQVNAIDLDQPGQPRAFAQAIAFGPGGKLYVPITGNGPDTGSVRAYDVISNTFEVFVPPAAQGGALTNPWYLTFGQTNPATLAYNTKPGAETGRGGSAATNAQAAAEFAQWPVVLKQLSLEPAAGGRVRSHLDQVAPGVRHVKAEISSQFNVNPTRREQETHTTRDRSLVAVGREALSIEDLNQLWSDTSWL